jgi:hypothetical protein
MPIKKKLVNQNPPPNQSAPKAKRTVSRPKKSVAAVVTAPAVHRIAYTPAIAKLAKKREAKLGPPLMPQDLPGASQDAGSVVGQTWEVLSSGENPPLKITWTFFDDGMLIHDKITVGLWRQQGAVIVTEINGRYSQFHGVIKGDEASGEAKNIVGVKWTWTATIRG